MYLRCGQCQATTWMASYEPVAEQDVVCQTCGRQYRLAANDQMGATKREQYEYAVRFAETHLIDLPSAYSVLLGIMTVEEAQAAKQQENEKEQAAGAQPVRRPARSASSEVSAEDLYDPAFRTAIEQGCLTVQQAIERGSRDAYATRLANRHRLPRELAYKVADNRVTLQAASQETETRRARARVERERRKPASGAQRALIAIFALAVLAGVGAQSYRVWQRIQSETEAAEASAKPVVVQAAIETPEPARPADPTEGPRIVSTQLRTDPAGRVTQIVGPDPRSVLIAYCQSGSPEGSLQPMDLVEAVPPQLGARNGLFRDPQDPESVYAIVIRQDEHTQRWVAGDGAGPIRANPAAPPAPIAR